MVTKYVTTDILELAYLEHGPASGRPVLLLHGFPDDATSWDAVADRLAGHGARVLAPHTRGVGPTRFRLDETSRTGQLGALVTDAVAFLDALGVRRVTVAGQDWGARVAQGLAALHPERVEHLVSLGSYGLSWEDGGFPPPKVLHALWYQWLLMLELGDALLRYDLDARTGFFAYLWDVWSPTWTGRQQAFSSVRASLTGPDLADIVLSAYRHGRTDTITDARYDDVEAALAAAPRVEVPTTVLLGADDGIEQPAVDDPRDTHFFPHLRSRLLLEGVGHWPHRGAPDLVADALSGGPLTSSGNAQARQ